MSDSVRPHRWQPTRLPRPWDSPGKNSGVGCHFLLQCMKVKSESEVAQSCPTQRPHGLQPPRLLRPWDFPGKSTGVGCHCLLRIGLLELLFISCLVYHMFGGFTRDLKMVWWPSASWLLSKYPFSPTFYLPMKAQFLLVSGNFSQEHGLSHLSPVGRADPVPRKGLNH